MYDIIIIGGGASGLFFCANSPFSSKKLVLEKTQNLGSKLLVSGGGRGNITNINIDLENDYFGLNKKFLYSVFHKFSNQSFLDYLQKNGIKTKIEDNGRVILFDENTKNFLKFLLEKSKKNNTQILTDQNVKNIRKKGDIFVVETENGTFESSKLVVAVGGKSFAQLGTIGDGYVFAQNFGIDVVSPYKGLVGITIRNKFADISGNSIIAEISLMDGNKKIYSQKGNLLFTHYGISGPVVFNCTLAIGEYLSQKKISDSENYIKQNLKILVKPDVSQMTLKLQKYFGFPQKFQSEILMEIENINSWKEAKVTGGGVNLKEIYPTFESRKVPGLYFIGEVLDITGKTGGYNLQRCRSSAFVCAQNIL